MTELTMLDLFYLLSATFLLVGCLTPLMRRIAISADIFDRPVHSHKTHESPVPYLGGVGIILGILAVSYTGLIYKGREANDFWTASSLLLPAALLGFVGYLDDRKNLPPLPRFVAQSVTGVFTASILIATNTIGNPTDIIAVDALITVIWVVGISNAINFFDNLDGGAAGTIAVTSFAIFLITQSSGQYFLSALSITTLGAMLGFLIWNKSPARIYMGDAGALFLGVLVAVLTLRLNPEVDQRTISFAIPLLLLAIPILDTSVAVLSRLRRGISPWQGGRDHLSHRLIRMGLTKRQSAYALWSLSAIYSGIAVTIATTESITDLLLKSAITLWFVLFLAFFLSQDTDSN